MKRTMLFMLVLALAATGTISCGGGESFSETTAPKETDSTETSSPYSDDLPLDLNFGNETVTFLYREEVANEFWVESADGDVVNDAIYNSIRSVEERLNVNIEVATRPGHMANVRSEYMQHITNTILAGDDTYDWVDLMIGNSPTLMSEGLFTNLLDNQYIDLDKPYYLGGLLDNCAIDDKLYFISGDASLGYMKCAFCMYFNQSIADDFQVENLYELVNSGKWTMDKLMEISAQASSDLNADSKYDLEDKLGFVVPDWNQPSGIWAATGSFMYQKDSAGEWQFVYGSERDCDVVNKLYRLFFETDGALYPAISNTTPEHLETYNKIMTKFRSGEIFIISAEVDDAVSQLRSMQDDFGILPYPKYDENQEYYGSSARSTFNAFSMPMTCGDPDMAGAVLEALSSSNRDSVLPAYFEIALKTKYSRDNDSARMYDIIRDTMMLDFGFIFTNAVGNPRGLLMDSLGKENSLASNIASRKTSLETSLTKYIDSIKELEG